MTIPTNGLVFYAPLAENADCAYTLTNSGSVTFQTFGGRQCAYFDGSSALYNNSFQVADAFTFSFHAYFQSGDCLFALGPWTNSHNMEVMTNNGYPRLYTYKNGSDENLIDATTNIKDGWHHIACTYDGTTQKLYVDGNLSASRTFSATIGAGIALGTNFTSSGSIGRDTKMTGYLAACRVYNRALSDSEITELSKEFSTTGGSLDTVLSALDGARDALVTAINAKGGSLADNATLYQCADAVGSLSGGTSAEYYKCASVDVSAKTWSGYKAVFDSGTGTWSFESDVTEGLAYTSVTPIVGGIYSADALVIVSLLYTGTPTLTSPTGMTSESSDEWEISAKSNYSAYYPWKAFDGLSSPFTNCWSSQTARDQWLQWHNKKQKVLVQRLKLSVTDAPAQGPAEFILQGSDDGTLWHDIHSESGLSWTTNGEAKEFAFSNNKSYYYHRLNEMWADSNVVSILELETYDM